MVNKLFKKKKIKKERKEVDEIFKDIMCIYNVKPY